MRDTAAYTARVMSSRACRAGSTSADLHGASASAKAYMLGDQGQRRMSDLARQIALGVDTSARNGDFHWPPAGTLMAMDATLFDTLHRRGTVAAVHEDET